jgi:peptidoglycan/xylan/chitin deacetylase (PgdA/CDA1 family)
MTLHEGTATPARTPALWPGGARAAVSVTFDNLGEAAEEELGLVVAIGEHSSVSTGLPIVLAELAETGLQATFFVEGINAKSYPDAVRSIVDAGHECSYHSWHHEDWSRLSDEEEKDNLSRGVAAMRTIGVQVKGFRPPGGRLGEHTLALVRDQGLRYCSPAGTGAGLDEVVLLPFAWPCVDAYHLLPQFAPLRAQVDGSDQPGGPDRLADSMIASIDQAIETGMHVTLLFHPMLIDTERDAFRDVLHHLRGATRRGEVWAAQCDEVAAWITDHADAFTEPPHLDVTSWLIGS